MEQPQYSENQNPCRSGERAVPNPRSGRYFTAENRWYFYTREGKMVGPYSSKENVEKAVQSFVKFASKVSPERLTSLIDSYLEKLQNYALKHLQGPKRAGESKIPALRSNRLYSAGEGWFFKTREGEVIGPYAKNGDAIASAKLFTEFASTISAQSLSTLIDTMNGALTAAPHLEGV